MEFSVVRLFFASFEFQNTYFKNVILMEQPSAAPTPVSRKIFRACSKFGALNNDLVMKCRATNEVYTKQQNRRSL